MMGTILSTTTTMVMITTMTDIINTKGPYGPYFFPDIVTILSIIVDTSNYLGLLYQPTK